MKLYKIFYKYIEYYKIMFLDGIINILSFGYNTITFLYNTGFIGGCVVSLFYHINTVYKRNGNEVICFNGDMCRFNEDISSLPVVQNSQVCIQRKHIPLFLPFVTPFVIYIAPVIFIKNIKYIKNNIYRTIYIAREFRDRKPVISNFVEQKPDYCPVCTENFSVSDKTLSCGHYIHRECIIKSKKTICPLCKSELILTIEEFMQIKYPQINK
jgi:RNA polymerase subunit RPABC4/transcription elongation factor Spt4